MAIIDSHRGAIPDSESKAGLGHSIRRVDGRRHAGKQNPDTTSWDAEKRLMRGEKLFFLSLKDRLSEGGELTPEELKKFQKRYDAVFGKGEFYQYISDSSKYAAKETIYMLMLGQILDPKSYL